MSVTEVVVEIFWQTATQMISIVAPVIGILLVFKIIRDVLFKEK